MKKKKKFNEIHVDKDRFFSMIQLGELEFEEGETTTIDIEMLRIGNFKHKKYGELEITEEMLDAMVDNFKNEIIGREVSFDWNHKAEDASGWLKDVKIEDGRLIGTTELTDKGCDSIQKKRYGYFSIEYTDEFENAETGDKFGPAILGGALTNRPFISNLKKIEFLLEESGDVSIYRLQSKEDGNMPDEKKKVKREPAKKIEDLTPEELVAKLTEATEKIKELEDKIANPDDKKKIEGDDKKLEGDKKFEEFILAQQKENKKLADALEGLKEENKTLKEGRRSDKDEARTLKIKNTCENLLRDEHHHPSVIAIAKELMLNSEDGAIFKFSETVGEGDEKKTVELELSFNDSILKLLAAIPASQRADYTERTTSSDGIALTEEDEEKLYQSAKKKTFQKVGLKLVESGK